MDTVFRPIIWAVPSQSLDPYPYLMRAPAPIELNSENSRRRRWLVPESRDPSRRDVLAVGSSGGALPALPGWCSTKCVRKDAPSMGGDGVHLQPEPRSRLAEAAARGPTLLAARCDLQAHTMPTWRTVPGSSCPLTSYHLA